MVAHPVVFGFEPGADIVEIGLCGIDRRGRPAAGPHACACGELLRQFRAQNNPGRAKSGMRHILSAKKWTPAIVSEISVTERRQQCQI